MLEFPTQLKHRAYTLPANSRYCQPLCGRSTTNWIYRTVIGNTFKKPDLKNFNPFQKEDIDSHKLYKDLKECTTETASIPKTDLLEHKPLDYFSLHLKYLLSAPAFNGFIQSASAFLSSMTCLLLAYRAHMIATTAAECEMCNAYFSSKLLILILLSCRLFSDKCLKFM